MNKLEQLRKITKVVADTGDIEAIKKYLPVDATTNPSLLLKSAQQSQYHYLLDDAIEYAHQHASNTTETTLLALDRLAVNFAGEILKIVPGRVSIEVDARLSFDTDATVRRAQRLIELCKSRGIDTQRILIKVASTWEGIRAGEILERQGIHCNLTLMFHLAQAVACAQAGVTLVSPFVGRILDWYKKSESRESYLPVDDPGVKSVIEIFHYFKKHNYPTVVMGASFRNTGEILELAGCDLLTIAPPLMEELRNSEGKLERKLDPKDSAAMQIPHLDVSESNFRWLMNDSAMATEKLAEGIRNFTKDTIKLESLLNDACMKRSA
ncbi:MAG: transaldolase [Gammaproteobacteria bacterium]